MYSKKKMYILTMQHMTVSTVCNDPFIQVQYTLYQGYVVDENGVVYHGMGRANLLTTIKTASVKSSPLQAFPICHNSIKRILRGGSGTAVF